MPQTFHSVSRRWRTKARRHSNAAELGLKLKTDMLELTTNSHLFTMATFFVSADGPYIHFYSDLSRTAKPLNRIPTTNVTLWPRPVIQRLTHGICKTPHFYCKRSRNLIRTAQSFASISVWFLGFIDTFWLWNVFTCYINYFLMIKMTNFTKKQCQITSLHLSTTLTLLQGCRYGELTYITNYIPRHNSKLNHWICLWLNTFGFLSGFTWLYLRLESCEW